MAPAGAGGQFWVFGFRFSVFSFQFSVFGFPLHKTTDSTGAARATRISIRSNCPNYCPTGAHAPLAKLERLVGPSTASPSTPHRELEGWWLAAKNEGVAGGG
jgi:hypothetical protein